jgi:hypothetical protein
MYKSMVDIDGSENKQTILAEVANKIESNNSENIHVDSQDQIDEK